MKLHRTLFTAWVFAAGVALHAQNAHNMVVQTNKLGAEIQPTMYGLFFEDINYGADGGLYAELVKNRSFEFPVPGITQTDIMRISFKRPVIHQGHVTENIPPHKTLREFE